ncbi:hypothetical protein [Leucobacter tenebrionis]|uniref:hypothetical protein n=1 Tax=Leucobacter tenebrionis TaxID=2873270 RepID=UPI001CA6D2B3|nr:hypothetical protein [Leucobacter tenebrionis]QZY52686.1 hypothetical protein KVY00_04335 [Leucobacter tenebrionis]
MEVMNWIFWGLRTILQFLPPVEMVLTLGLILFGLSWIRPRRIVSLPSSGRRVETLRWVGIAGSLAVVAVGSVTSWIATLDPLNNWGGWWQRPAPLAATALVILVAALLLRREPLLAPGEGAISPRRRWWAFTPRASLWILFASSSLLLVTTAWQLLIGVSAPPGANRYGIVPPETGLPVYMTMQNGMGYVWGAGWPNHLATLLVLLTAAFALVALLSTDANRPLFARSSAAEVREERASTAQIITLLALGGLLLTLGAVWAHVGFIGQIIVGVFEDNGGAPDPQRFVVGTGYQSIAPLMHLGGYVVQGIGAALLLRLAVDTGRAVFAGRRAASPDPDPSSPAPATASASSDTGAAR